MRIKAEYKQRVRQRAAFTLLEVLLVLVILGLLAGLVAPALFGTRDKANRDAARLDINTLLIQCDRYNLDMNSYPTSLQQLISNDSQSVNWAGPYLDVAEIPNDPWDTPYVFEPQPSGKPKIFSAGPDKQPNTSDDIQKDETAQQ